MSRAPIFGVTVLRLVVGTVFLWSGLVKIPEPALFAGTVRAYEVLPLWLVNPFAVVVPWIEACTGAALVVGVCTRSSGIVSLGLLGSFAIAIVMNLWRGADLSCGCFSLDGTEGSLTEALVRDLLLIVACLALVLVRRPLPLSVDGWLSRSRREAA